MHGDRTVSHAGCNRGNSDKVQERKGKQKSSVLILRIHFDKCIDQDLDCDYLQCLLEAMGLLHLLLSFKKSDNSCENSYSQEAEVPGRDICRLWF